MYRLKKSLGQHFLKDENVCRKIIQVLKEQSFHQLIEVGPGAGALTKYILEIPAIDFKAVEIDHEKIDYLLKTYPAIKGRVVHEDFLEMKKPFDGKFTVIGNFPYNISTQILFKILDWKDDVEEVIGMFQKEVAQRIVATEGNKIYGVTSVLIQAFFNVEYLFDVSEKSFQPPPKVKSGLIRLSPVKKKLAVKSESEFFLLVKTAFNQRRKTLRNAVKNLFDATTLQDELFNKRAEQLSIKDFASLSFKLKTK